jgi:phenylalanyl-tRNA synthetase alpha chain
MNIENQIEQILNTFSFDYQNLDKDTLYLKYFSKTNGLVTGLIKQIPSLSKEDKRIYGQKINEISRDLEAKINSLNVSEKTKLDETIKITEVKNIGHLHPVTETVREMNNFFKYYGFSVYEGPEIETEEYNFRKLNLPENHPATDLQDSLYIKPGVLLRTHTSSIETRVLTNEKPPIRVVMPGTVFRNETPSATNASFFHQYQGVVVDKNINIKNLISTLTEFHKYLFGPEVVIRFRYKYYPEVSPGLGTDIQCLFCKGEGCKVCKYRGYIEVLGSGMIHYNTLKMCGIDPEEYSGFAFGMGLSRLVMQRHKIDSIKKLYGGEITYQ